MATARRSTFAAAHWVIHWIHGDASVVRTPARPTCSSRFADLNTAVFDIANLADRRPAIQVDLANLT
jgi:hypothetical protein